MPRILIETGFLTNANEEKYLISAKGQDELAKSIFNAFKSYKNSIESQKGEQDLDVKAEIPPLKSNDLEKQTGTLKNSDDTTLKDSVKNMSNKISQETTAKDTDINVNKKEIQTIAAPVNNSGENILLWSVQFFTSPKPISDKHKIYSEFRDVREDFENGVYKYSTGLLKDKSEAVKLQAKLRQQGYKDSFVVVFFNNKKISVKEATEKSIIK